MQPVGDGRAHQFVVGRVVLDLVDAIAVPVVGMQHRTVAVGKIAPALSGDPAGQRTEFGDLLKAPTPALANQCFDEHR